MSITVRPEVPSDIADIEALTVAAFLNAPHASHTEHLIVRLLVWKWYCMDRKCRFTDYTSSDSLPNYIVLAGQV